MRCSLTKSLLSYTISSRAASLFTEDTEAGGHARHLEHRVLDGVGGVQQEKFMSRLGDTQGCGYPLVSSEQDAAFSQEHTCPPNGCGCPWGSDMSIAAATLIPS